MYNKYFYDESLNLLSNDEHNSPVLKKTHGFEIQCDKMKTQLNMRQNQKNDLQQVIKGSYMKKKPNSLLKTEHGYTDEKINLKKTSSSPYDIYRTFPFKSMSDAVFKRTPSPRLKKCQNEKVEKIAIKESKERNQKVG
ncbi:uncharacterized protein LOC126902707 [Daktulosphaira vitifoliae]|uniref:uncharacterized protein LOC126902707 n=1 Tax=Daktulosphaira vitifoliae TaxID=58002 RepID=UPI0021AA21BD|nr:uncharacterized protein LOC126902707 [Daktulosphaira vitifoliae]XP_050536233.1 uncharacterized protein LOC126902707 [Daktulosphaira vitifoliae]